MERDLWQKFNDSGVELVTWEQVSTEARGNYGPGVSAYGLCYVKASAPNLLSDSASGKHFLIFKSILGDLGPHCTVIPCLHRTGTYWESIVCQEKRRHSRSNDLATSRTYWPFFLLGRSKIICQFAPSLKFVLGQLNLECRLFSWQTIWAFDYRLKFKF